MVSFIVIVFLLTYTAIAFENPLQINKAASVLLGTGLLWTIYAFGLGDASLLNQNLGESLKGIVQVVLFLMGAMVIVEVMYAHDGFDVITKHISATKLSSLMWIVGFVTFFCKFCIG